jgi:phage terminase small subunit
MPQGRKPVLVKGNKFHQLPTAETPRAVHIKISKDLQPSDFMSDSEIAIWNEYGPWLVMLGRLKKQHVPAFMDYCHTLNEIREARAWLKENGATYTSMTKNGQQLKSRPEVAQLNDNWRKFRSMIGEFGLAPNSERQLDLTATTFKDSFDEF